MTGEEQLFQFLRDLIYEDDAGDLDIEALPENLQDLGQGLLQLSIWIKELKSFAASLADGQLGVIPPGRDNPIAGNLKALQATMNHMAWQADQVTKGDYSQRVDYLGDLSKAFNEMTEQLKVKTEELEESRDKAIQSRDEYKEVAFVDDMTGLHNRHYIMPVLERFLERKFNFCISFIDLDHLKQANDLHGHSEGDRYIREAAKVLEAIPLEKEVARVGGDEFLILAQDISGEVLTGLLEQARQDLMKSSTGDANYTRSFSYGVVSVRPQDDYNRSDLLREADRKMYSYKYKQKNQAVLRSLQSKK